MATKTEGKAGNNSGKITFSIVKFKFFLKKIFSIKTSSIQEEPEGLLNENDEK